MNWSSSSTRMMATKSPFVPQTPTSPSSSTVTRAPSSAPFGMSIERLARLDPEAGAAALVALRRPHAAPVARAAGQPLQPEAVRRHHQYT